MLLDESQDMIRYQPAATTTLEILRKAGASRAEASRAATLIQVHVYDYTYTFARSIWIMFIKIVLSLLYIFIIFLVCACQATYRGYYTRRKLKTETNSKHYRMFFSLLLLLSHKFL